MGTLLHIKIGKITFATNLLKPELCQMKRGTIKPDTILQKSVVEHLVRRVLRLQFDVASVMTSSLFAGERQPVGRVAQIFEELWGVFLSLDSLYGTLTTLERQANETGFHPAELKQLQISWTRLNRLAKQIKVHLEGEKFLTAGNKCSTVH
jgi:hypothetical protein